MKDEGGGASRSTDPAAGTSSATDVSLREYIALMVELEMRRVNERFTSVEKATASAFENSQRAIDKADQATEKRFEGVNEFRAALSDQASRFVTAEQLNAVADKLEAGYLRNREDIDQLGKRLDLKQGEDHGSRLTWGNMAALVATAGVLITIVVIVANYLAQPG